MAIVFICSWPFAVAAVQDLGSGPAMQKTGSHEQMEAVMSGQQVGVDTHVVSKTMKLASPLRQLQSCFPY
jgi:hypothetical protein